MKFPFQLLLMLFLLSGCKDKPESTQPVVEDISESVYASGTVKSKNQYQVYPMVSGTVQQIMVTEGDEVQKGSPILKVVDDAARLNTENARLAAEYALGSTHGEKLSELQASIELAESKKHNDSLLMVRQRNLWKRGIGTRVALEQSVLNYENAATAWQSTIFRYNDLKKQLDFTARQSKKNLQLSQLMAEDYTVKSETNGRVYSILKEKGEMVSPQTPVALIGDANEYILELQVDEYDIARIKTGQRVLLNLDSYKGQVFEASISKINPAMNERTRSFVVEASFVKRPPVLFPNLSSEANIIIQLKKNALTIPRDYLLDDSYVLLEDNRKVQVKTGLKDYRKVEIVEGLSQEDVIVKHAP